MMKHERIDPAEGPVERGGPGRTVYVHERMSRPVVTVAAGASLDEALRLMAAHRIHYLPVVDDDRLVGVVNSDDVLGTRRPALPRPAIVSAVMSTPAISIGPWVRLDEAMRLMADRRIGALPVVEGGRVVGIFTQSDVVAAVGS
jgi:acetoin utilization protein AcuB